MSTTYVRITDLDDIDGKYPPITCRADDLAEALQNGGWFDRAPLETRGAIHALQRAVLAGADTDGLQRQLGVTVATFSAAAGPFLGVAR